MKSVFIAMPSIFSASRLFFNFSLLLVFLCSPQFISLSEARQNEIESILHKHGEVIVRVSFEDPDQARNFGLGLEPMQSDYEKGYLVFHLTREEYTTLAGALDDTTMRMSLDAALTEKHITNFQPTVQQSASQRQGAQMPMPGLDVSNYDTIPGYACYRTVEDTFQTALDIVAAYPGLASWTDKGDSWEKVNLGATQGFDMMVLKLTNSAISGDKPKVFFTSAIHAREYTTAELMTRFATQLVENYGEDADTTWILDHHEIHMMLMTNPDGRKQAETGRLWRKNTNQGYCGATSNNRGADLNRNFDFKWNCCGGSSSGQCDATYHGHNPASEPETQAVMDYIDELFDPTRGGGDNDPASPDTMGLYIDVHSSGRLILWPWGWTSTPSANSTQLQTLGRKLAFFNDHEPKQSIGLYPTDGTTISYAYGKFGLPSYLYELGTEFFEECDYFENILLPDNLSSLAYLVKTARQPYVLPAGPDVINPTVTPSSATGVPAGTLVTLNMTATDQRFNNSNGTEPTQSVVSAAYFIDVPPWSIVPSPVSQPMSVVDGSGNSSVEGFDAVIDTTGLSEGRHSVYIQATDADSITGVVSAVFLYINNDAVAPVTVFTDDFETDKGWQPNPSGSDTASTGHWERANPQSTSINGVVQQLGTTVSGSFDLVTGPLAGSSAGTHDIDNGVTSILSPVINLPAASSVTLSFEFYMAHLDNATTADYFRVSIIEGTNLTPEFEELGSNTDDFAIWQSQTVDLTGYADKSIQILIEAADAGGGSLVEAAVDDLEITAILANQPPDVDNPGNQTYVEGSVVDLPIVASDPENDPLSYSVDVLPAGLVINSSGVIMGTLTGGPQVVTSIVTVSDDQGNDTTVTFNWTIINNNAAPQITDPGNQISDEGDTIFLDIDASDPDSDPLKFSAAGLPPGLSIDLDTGVISGELDFDSSGLYSVTVTVSDMTDTDSVVFDWTVNNVNRVPVFSTPIGNQTSNEGDSISFDASAIDPDADELTYSATGLPTGIQIDMGTGELSGILDVSSAGEYSVTITVNETVGPLSASQSFDWTIIDINLPPILTNPGNQSSESSAMVSLQVIASDPENALLRFSAVDLPSGLSIDSDTGLITGTVDASVGSYLVTVGVSDGVTPVSVSFNWEVTDDSTTGQTLYVSSTSGGSVGGVNFSDEDILIFDTATNSWHMYIDGSDIGLSGSGARDINAFTLLNDGSVIFSVAGGTTLPDVGTVDDSDLIHFIPTLFGSDTAGTFEFYFDGSDVGLTTNGEDIDSVSLTANGNILISTIGSHNVPGASGNDEDLLLFTPTQLGSTTTGDWSVYFDGSDVGLATASTEDVYAAWLDEPSGDIYLSTRGDFSVSGLSGNGADIFTCKPMSTGTSTNCVFELFWDGAAFGFGSENIDGLFIE